MGYGFRYFPLLRQWVDWSEGAAVVICWEWVVVPGFWVGLRDNFRGEKVAEGHLTFVQCLVFTPTPLEAVL